MPTFSARPPAPGASSLLDSQGQTWARIGEQVGHADLVTTARTNTHVLADEQELDYATPPPNRVVTGACSDGCYHADAETAN